MALDNLISVEFTQAEIDIMNKALDDIIDVLKGKTVNLTPQQRQQYGRLGNRTENFVNKIGMYSNQRPEIVPVFINQQEVMKDVVARAVLTPILKKMNSIYETIEDTHKLIGWDIYSNVLAIYRNIKMLAKQNMPGINVIFDDLKAQFPQHGRYTGEEVVFETDPTLDSELNNTTPPTTPSA